MSNQTSPRIDRIVIMSLGIGGILLSIILFTIFNHHYDKIWINKVQSQKFSGKIIDKKYKRGEYLLNIRLNSPNTKDTVVKVNQWPYLYDLSKINDSIYKNTSDCTIFVRSKNEDFWIDLKVD